MSKMHTIVIAVILLLCLCSCGSVGTDSLQHEEPIPSESISSLPIEYPSIEIVPAKEPVKIQIMVDFGIGVEPSQIAIHEELQKEFNETIGKEKGIILEFVTTNDYIRGNTFLTSLYTEKNIPDICGPISFLDVAGLYNPEDHYDIWLDLSPYIERDNYNLSVYDENLINGNRFVVDGESRIFGLPMGYYSSALFYNADIYDKAGLEYPPTEWGTSEWTYDKLYEQARIMTIDQRGNTPNDPSFNSDNVIQYGYDGTDWSPWRVWIGKFLDESGKSVALGMTNDYKTATMNSPEWICAFTELDRMIYVEKVRPTADAADKLFGIDDPLGSNKLGAWEVFSWMSYAFDSWDSKFNWNIGAIPSMNGHVVSATQIDTFAIAKSTKHPEEAWEVYKWLFSEDVCAKLYHSYDEIPARKSLQTQWLNEHKAERPNINWQVLLDASKYTSVPNCESWSPSFSDIWNTVLETMNAVVNGKTVDGYYAYEGHLYTLEELLNNLNEEAQYALDYYWAMKNATPYVAGENQITTIGDILAAATGALQP